MAGIPTGALIVMIASAISAIISIAMFFLVLWQAPRSRDNQVVALYLISVAVWSGMAFMARVAAQFGNDPTVFGYLTASSIGLTAASLVTLAVQFAALWERLWAKLLVVAAWLILIAATVLSFPLEFYGRFTQLPSGQLDYTLSPLALIFIGVFYLINISGVLILFINRRKHSRALLLGGLGSLGGMIFSLIPVLTRFALPILSAMSSSILIAYAILQENLFNPLAELNRELAQANRELAYANQMKSQFLANMSHELRTPLNSIIGYTELLLNELYGPLSPDQKDRMRRVLRNGKNLLMLINDVLDLSKIEAGRMELSKEIIELPELIDSGVSTVYPQANEKGLTISVNLPDQPPSLYADEIRLRQMLNNLISNAVKFTKEGGVYVSVSVDDDAQMLNIAVRDTGIGIPSNQIDGVFEEFHQLDGTTTREHGGTGLGLAITQRLAHMHGGDINVESKLGEGSTFTISLPLADDHRPADAPPPRPESASTQGAPRPLILVIDDEQEAVDLIRDQLTSNGFRVESATSGEQGLQLAREIQPAAITLDIMMPGMDGWEVLNRLRTAAETADLPVVIVSVVDNRPLALELGAYEFVPKPIQQERLLSILQQAISKPSRHPLLIVDDNPDDRDLISTMLTNAGYPVVAVNGGAEAIDWLDSHSARLVILDLMMPHVSGFDVLHHIRSQAATRDLPVIVVTAKSLTPSDQQYLTERLTAVVRKQGLVKDQLVEEIKDALT